MADTDNHGPVVTRRWWLAALLIIPGGIGYLYIGRPKRFVVLQIFGVGLHACTFIPAFPIASSPFYFLVFLAVSILGMVIFMADAARLAIKQRNYRLGFVNHRLVYGLGIVIAVLISYTPDILGYFFKKQISTYSTASLSMAPTLEIGDLFTAAPTAYDKELPRRGDVAVFRNPQDETVIYVMRLIGLPGDTIKLENGIVILNGTPVKRKLDGPWQGSDGLNGEVYIETLPNGRSYKVVDLGPGKMGDTTQSYTVPEGHYFFLGDNRDNSLDSRYPMGLGLVPKANLAGRTGFIYWSSTLSRIATPLN